MSLRFSLNICDYFLVLIEYDINGFRPSARYNVILQLSRLFHNLDLLIFDS